MALYLGNTKITPIISKGTSTAKLITKSVDSNGVYSAADDDADGYSKFTVNVQYTGQEKTLNPSKTTQIIVPDSGYNGITKITLNPVTSSIDENIISSNIKQGVSILGVTGTLETKADPVLQSKTITPTKLNQTITPDTGYDALSSVIVNGVTSDIDSNITAGNIKEGVSILGITGTLKPVAAPNLQNKSATPLTTNQTIEPDEGYDGLSYVSISKVDSSIDSNIVAGNIKKDISILGVTGTYEGDGSGETIDPKDAVAYRTRNRNPNWPDIPLPSEMDETKNSGYLLYLGVGDLTPIYVNMLPKTVSGTNVVTQIKFYNNKQLLYTETTASTSCRVRKYIKRSDYPTASNYNYIVINYSFPRATGKDTLYFAEISGGGDRNLEYAPADRNFISPLLEVSINHDNVVVVPQYSSSYCASFSNLEYFSAYGLNRETIHSGNIGGMELMGPYCENLKCLPQLKFTSSTEHIACSRMFKDCHNLEVIDKNMFDGKTLQTSDYMFSNCWKIKYIPPITIGRNQNSIAHAFEECWELENFPISNFGDALNKDISYTFKYCRSFKSNVLENLDLHSFSGIGYLFQGCDGITEIPATFKMPNNTNVGQVFGMDYYSIYHTGRTCKITKYEGSFANLTITMQTGAFSQMREFNATNINKTLDIRNNNLYNLYSREQLLKIFNNLETVTDTQTLTIGEKALALLSDEDKAIATNKNWTLA